jgi:hypothetical protein
VCAAVICAVCGGVVLCCGGGWLLWRRRRTRRPADLYSGDGGASRGGGAIGHGYYSAGGAGYESNGRALDEAQGGEGAGKKKLTAEEKRQQLADRMAAIPPPHPKPSPRPHPDCHSEAPERYGDSDEGRLVVQELEDEEAGMMAALRIKKTAATIVAEASTPDPDPPARPDPPPPAKAKRKSPQKEAPPEDDVEVRWTDTESPLLPPSRVPSLRLSGLCVCVCAACSARLQMVPSDAFSSHMFLSGAL